MINYKKVPLSGLLDAPDNPNNYLKLNSYYWALDNKDNVFFIGSNPICSPSKVSVRFYIRRLHALKTCTIVNIQQVWVRKLIGYSRNNGV